MSARENILSRIRQQSGRSGLTTDAELASVRAHIALCESGPLPSIAHENSLERFVSESARLKSTVESLQGIESVPQAVAGYFRQNNLERSVVGWPSFSNLDWAGAGVHYQNRLAEANDMVGLTDCFCAIGETGTLLLLSSPTTPKLHALLPETHICIVSKSRIVATMEAAFKLLRAERGALPRATFLVSGPSRTADIEQTMVIGAHGPYRVHILMIP